MADVFISYASEDRDRAEMLASALSVLGWTVWWDRSIIIGQAFDHAIERELETAKSVVVLWSRHSIGSEWVKNEAAVASERGVLVPGMIDSVKLPLEFRRKQTAELIDWKGETSHRGFQALCDGIASTVGGNRLQQPIPGQGQRLPWRSRVVLATIATIVVALGLGVYLTGPWQGTVPMPIPQTDRSELSTPSENKKPLGAVAELADLVVGTYFGAVMADSKGGSRSDVGVTITKLDRSTIRVTSDYRRLATVDVPLTRIGNQILNAEGDTPFVVDLDRNPPTLLVNPRNEVAYSGTKQK
jgi:hypothetical protein